MKSSICPTADLVSNTYLAGSRCSLTYQLDVLNQVPAYLTYKLKKVVFLVILVDPETDVLMAGRVFREGRESGDCTLPELGCEAGVL